MCECQLTLTGSVREGTGGQTDRQTETDGHCPL